MALPTTTNDAFLREVDDELRREKIETFWRRRGKLVAVGVVVALALLAAVLFLLNQREQHAQRASEQLVQLLGELDQGNVGNAPKVLAQLGEAKQPGYRAAAGLLRADLALGRGDDATAFAAYQAVIDDGSLPQPFRDAALVRLVAARFDALAPADVIARLRPLAQPGNPWFGSAGEMTAMAQLKLGHRDLAGALFAAISRDRLVPDSIRSRAAQMASGLGVDAGVDMGERR